jgi:hypothetical protein
MWCPPALQCFLQRAGLVGVPAVHYSCETNKSLALAGGSGARCCLAGIVPIMRLVYMRFQEGGCFHPLCEAKLGGLKLVRRK